MKVKFIRDWRGNTAGEVKEVGDGVGEAYIVRGVARMVEGVTQTQTIPQMVATAIKRGRGRPRKNTTCLTS